MTGMQLHKLIAALVPEPWRVDGPADREISAVCYDSRKVVPGSLFVALPSATPGRTGDAASGGAAFVYEAVDRGAAAVITEQEMVIARATAIRVRDARAALADVAAVFYGHPDLQLQVAGVTGTNGKTTSAFLLKHLLDAAQRPCGLIGTVRYVVGERILPAGRTTPEAADVQRLLREMRDVNCRAVAMEVSSHALAQGRVRGMEFDAAVFTNLTQDHLDYHGTMENYFQSKLRFFTSLPAQTRKRAAAVVNADDRYGRRILDEIDPSVRRVTYGQGMGATLRAADVRADLHGTQYSLHVGERSYLVRLPLIGAFNVYNSLAALGAMHALGHDLRNAVGALRQAPQIPGRLEMVRGPKAFRVYVDYAHTPDALENVLNTLRGLQPDRLITVFGCGGDRDAGKRAPMGRIASRLSDHLVITSDNPRREDPAAIIAGILEGVQGGSHEVLSDRAAAIRHAVRLARPGDIVLVAGKGHEDYQEFADGRVPFDDVTEAEKALRERTQ